MQDRAGRAAGRPESRAPMSTAGLKIKTRQNRNVVTGLFPSPHGTQDAAAMTGIGDIGRGPDMIQPPPLVGRVPILGTIAPPAVKQPRGNILAGDINPFPGILRRAQMLDLDRGMADDLEQLLVRPDVILARGDVQVAHQHGPLRRPAPGGPVRDLPDEIQLVREFRVGIRVWNVAAGRDIEIVQFDRFAQVHEAMTTDLTLLPADATPTEVFDELSARRHKAALAVRDGKLVGLMTLKGAVRAALYQPALDASGKLKIGAAVAQAEGLSIPGLVGTAKNRLTDQSVAGQLRVKTGSLAQVTSMAGNVSRTKGGLLSFAVIVNNPTNLYSARIAINTFMSSLAGL